MQIRLGEAPASAGACPFRRGWHLPAIDPAAKSFLKVLRSSLLNSPRSAALPLAEWIPILVPVLRRARGRYSPDLPRDTLRVTRGTASERIARTKSPLRAPFREHADCFGERHIERVNALSGQDINRPRHGCWDRRNQYCVGAVIQLFNYQRADFRGHPPHGWVRYD